MAYASPSDVQARLGRPLTTDEPTQVPTLLDDCEIVIVDKIPDLADQVDADPKFLARVVLVECNAVRRLLRNPDGYTSETDGDYTYQINYKLATGELTITSNEWSLLGVGSGIFTITPSVLSPLMFRPVPFDCGG